VAGQTRAEATAARLPRAGTEALRRVASVVRASRWGIAVSLLVLTATLFVYWSTPGAQVPVADGYYSWIFARSIAFDGDVDFANDYALCGDPWRIGIDRGTGHPDNIFYPGPTLFWVPVVWLAGMLGGWGDPAATCTRAWTAIAFGTAPWAAALATYLSYAVARRVASDGVAALAAAFMAFGSPLLKFGASLPSYSHVYDALCTSALVAASLWAAQRPAHWARWTVVAGLLTACILQRPSDVLWWLVPVALAGSLRRGQARGSGMAIAIAITTVGALAGVGILGRLYDYLYGSPFTFTHGRYFLHPAHAHPLLALFDMEEGLLLFAPSTWWAILGLLCWARRPQRIALFIPLLVVGGAELFLSSAALDWAPARRLTNLLPLMVLLAALPLATLARWLSRGRQALVVAGALAVWPTVQSSIGYAWGYPRGLVPSERPLTQEELYGSSVASYWRLVDTHVGAPSVWPAQLAFRLRYGLPMSAFGEAAFPRWFVRDFRSLKWIDREIPLTDPSVRELSVGMEPSPRGLRLVQPSGRIVLGLQWPVVTHLQVRATTADPGGRLRVGAGRLFGSPRWFGTAVPLQQGDATYEFEVPAGALGSGINELVIEISDVPPQHLVLRSLRLDDRRPLEPLSGTASPLD